MSDWGKIAIGTRMYDSCDSQFFNSWSHLIAGGMRHEDTVMDSAIEMPQHFAATVLTIYFLKTDADTLCMVDCDMVFKQDTLSRLRDDPAGWQYDILSALSVTRRAPFYPIVLKLRADGAGYECIKEKIDGSILDVDSVGTGFTLIRRSVFDAMKNKLDIDRWFFEWGDNGLGEDTRFCQRARKLNCRIGVHTGVSIEHRGKMTFSWDSEKKITKMQASDQLGVLL